MKMNKVTDEDAKELQEKMSNLDQKSKVLVNTYIQAMLDRQQFEAEHIENQEKLKNQKEHIP